MSIPCGAWHITLEKLTGIARPRTNDENSTVHGIVTEDGLFDGTIVTSSEEIYIEPTSRYMPLICHRHNDGEVDAGLHHHTIAYRSTDVTIHRSNQYPCASENLRKTMAKRFMTNRTWSGYLGDTMQPLYQHLNEERGHAKPGFYPKDARRKDPTASSHNLELLDKLYRERYSRVLRKRTSVDPRKTTCMLYLQADHTFFEHYKSEEACIEIMTRHVQRVNSIYRYTDFNQDGQPDNISFMIKRVKVHGENALQDPTYRFTDNYGVEEFLELFSEEDYDAFCLSYMFTYRDFEKGTLGLAWTGDLKNAGGVCEKNGHYRGSMKSLNTGIITLLNYGKHVPPTVSHVTLAHEIGHNFGSPHDPDECSPGGEDGNFIMFARATSGDKRNNNRFSPCSLVSINPVLNAKARSTKGCFAEPQTAICGNGVVEEGEECDCGWEENCNDPCCHPQRLYHAPHEIPCRLADGAVCSPSQGPCCTSGCTLRNGDKCRDDNGCRDASFCDGRGPQCPPSINKPNKTICNEEFVCYMGECTGSICLAYGLESCQCIAGPEDPPTKSCELCCKLPGEDQPCLSSFVWNSAPYDIPDMLSKPGTPCNDYNGYCDVFQRCREVDPSGPLATLRRLLLSDLTFANFQRWLIDRWYTVTFTTLLLLMILITITRLLSKQRINRTKGDYQMTHKISSKHSPEESSRNSLLFSAITRIKKRIMKAMKFLASLRRKKDDEPREERACLMEILRQLGKTPTLEVNSNKQSLNVDQYGIFDEYNTESMKNKSGEKDDRKMTLEDCKVENVPPSKQKLFNRPVKKNKWKRVSVLLLEKNHIVRSFLLKKNEVVSRYSTWFGESKSRNATKSIVNVHKTSDGYQTKPLMDPETFDTPMDFAEKRIQTSDLTVLLPKS